MSQSNNVVWVRVGDEDDYHEFDTVEDVAEYLALALVRKIERHTIIYGVTASGYQGNNYISLFWGTPDERADPTRELTNEEIDEINESLDSCDDCGYYSESE